MRFFFDKKAQLSFSYYVNTTFKKKKAKKKSVVFQICCDIKNVTHIQTYIHTYIQEWFYRSLSVFNRGPISDAYTSFTSFNILGCNMGNAAQVYRNNGGQLVTHFFTKSQNMEFLANPPPILWYFGGVYGPLNRGNDFS